MELLISILMWLGLITAGNTYTTQDIQQIAAANQAAVQQTHTDWSKGPQANVVATPVSGIDKVIIGLH
ncbi:MAG: hypothetical protein RIR53_1377 [Bacteroidota bacterium]|jgi:hypothetical protein